MKHDIHITPKSYKLEILGELVVYHGIRAWFGRMSWVRVTSLQFEYLIPICVFENLYWTPFDLFDSPRAGMRHHVREGVKHDIHIKPKSYKLELLGELVV